MVRSRGWQAAALLVLTLFFSSCTTQQNAQTAPDPATILQAIPPADPSKYQRIADMKQWRNPYVIVNAEDLLLYDSADNAEIHLKPEELLPALAKLPASKWPYGRVVVVTDSGIVGSERDGVAIRRNRGIVGGILAGAKIAVNWVPSA